MATSIGTYVTPALLKERAGISGSDDDTLIGHICDEVNSWIEHTTGRVLAPVSSTMYLFDGFQATKVLGRDDDAIRLPLVRASDGSPTGGLRAVTLVEFAYYTGYPYQTLPSSQYFLREQAYPSGPYDALVFTDFPTSFIAQWMRGYNTTRITATAGPAAIPDDIAELAVNVAMQAWNARQTGSDTGGADELGRPILTRFVTSRDKATLRSYTLVGSLA